MTSAGSVGGDERLRLFLALELPPAMLDDLTAWGSTNLSGGGRVVPREHLHVTLAFLGSRPAVEVDAIVRVLRDAVAAGSEPIVLEPTRWRETRSVGMLVLADHGGAATRLAGRCHAGLERSASTGRRRGRGCRTSRCSDSASGRVWSPRCPGREHSFRPTRLLTFLDCTRPEPGTRCWNASR